MAIKILAADVAAKIAAGEVVERPASVVKELIENSIDASAREIKILIEEGGKKLIEVKDNGEGISGEDLPLTIERYATSKIESADDLSHVHTLGFRGEALASIASVSNMTIGSRVVNSDHGNRISSQGGVIKQIDPVGILIGTVIRVENLFFNTPARLKFLKQEISERRQILALVFRYSLAYSQKKFQLVMEGKPVLTTSGDGKHLAILGQMYGFNDAKLFLPVDFNEELLGVRGFISPIGLNRSNRKEMTFFVNGRWIQDVSLSSALLQAYHTLLMVGRFPIAALFLDVPPEEIDVNVHPAKTEIRFSNSNRIFSLVQRAVRRTLLKDSSPSAFSPKIWQTFNSLPKKIETGWEMASDIGDQQKMDFNDPSSRTSDNEKNPPIFLTGIPLLRLIGQIGATYLVAEGPDGLYLIDQHAAHERVLYDQFTKQKGSATVKQFLLEPITFYLNLNESHTLTTNLPIFNILGFDISEFGTQTFRIRAIPALFSKNEPVSIIKSALEEIEEDESPLKDQKEKMIIARICKKMAVKSGQILSTEEQHILLSNLEACESPRTCPHGRPTMIHLSVDLLESQFGRRGSR